MKRIAIVVLGVLLGGCVTGPGRGVDSGLLEYANARAVDMVLVEPGTKKAYWGGGSIIHEDGYILTCFHLSYGETDIYDSLLYLHDGTELHNDLLWTAQNYDLAVHKIRDNKIKLPAVRLGSARDVEKGNPVLIIGAPSGKRHDVQHGVISRLHCGAHPMRPGEESVATEFEIGEARVRGGHSGGPAFNEQGEQIGYVVIGIRGRSQLSFIRRVDMVRKALNDEFIADESRVGLKVDCRQDEARVTAVAMGSPADGAGLKAGDVIRQFGSMRIENSIHCALAMIDLDSLVTNGVVAIKYERDGKVLTAALRIS